MNEEFRLWLRIHLEKLATGEGLRVTMDSEDFQISLSRINGHLLGNPKKRARKTLPALVRNWFETDLREKNRRAGGSVTGGPGRTFTDKLAEKLRRQAREYARPRRAPALATGEEGK